MVDLDFLMAKPSDKLTAIQRALFLESQKSRFFEKITWETEAIKVIKTKIAHYKKTGNLRKLAIYQAKLKQKQKLLPTLTKLRGIFE